MMRRIARFQNALHRRRRANRQGGLLDDNQILRRIRLDFTGRLFPILQVGRTARPLAKGLGRRVDGDKDHIRFRNSMRNVRREKQILSNCGIDHFAQPRLVKRQRRRFPSVNPGFVDVDNRYFPVRTLLSNHGHRGSADIAGTNANNMVQFFHR